jgi:WD40 repeat protein
VHTNFAVALPLKALSEVPPSGFQIETLDPRAVRHFGVAFTPDSRCLITTDSEGCLVRWDARLLQRLEKLPALGSNHWAVALSPDGRWLATGDAPDKITIWDWTTRQAVTRFTVHLDWFGLLRFSPSSHFFSAACFRNDLGSDFRLWSTADWSEVPLTNTQFAGLWSADLSPNDRFLAAGYGSGGVKLFRWPLGEPEASFAQAQGAVLAVLFSPEGNQLYSVGFEGTVRVWDVIARRELAKLPGHLGLIGSAALFPDGRRLATGGTTARDAVKLWDLSAERELLSLQGEGHFFMHVACSPDGNTLAAISFSGIAHVWRAPSWEEIEAAEGRRAASTH